jgi:hypothetical protein
MGNCCAGEPQGGKEINMQKDYYGTNKGNYDHLFDGREVLGLTGREKIRLIVKI